MRSVIEHEIDDAGGEALALRVALDNRRASVLAQKDVQPGIRPGLPIEDDWSRTRKIVWNVDVGTRLPRGLRDGRVSARRKPSADAADVRPNLLRKIVVERNGDCTAPRRGRANVGCRV